MKIDDAIAKSGSVFGWLNEPEARTLYKLALQCKPSAGIVELGSFLGKSSVMLAAASEEIDVAVYCVDYFSGTGPSDPLYASTGGDDWLVRFYGNVSPLRVSAIQGSTAEFADQFSGHVGMLYIDAGHKYEEVAADWAAWKKHLIPGAIVAFHDYPNEPGVKQLVDEITESGEFLWHGRTGILTYGSFGPIKIGLAEQVRRAGT